MFSALPDAWPLIRDEFAAQEYSEQNCTARASDTVFHVDRGEAQDLLLVDPDDQRHLLAYRGQGMRQTRREHSRYCGVTASLALAGQQCVLRRHCFLIRFALGIGVLMEVTRWGWFLSTGDSRCEQRTCRVNENDESIHRRPWHMVAVLLDSQSRVTARSGPSPGRGTDGVKPWTSFASASAVGDGLRLARMRAS